MKAAARVGITMGVLVLSIAWAVYLWWNRPRVRERPAPPLSERVVVLSVYPTSLPVRVRGSGVVISSREIWVYPEVTGRIVQRHRNLEPGGWVSKGEVLITVDPRNYHAALQQALAGLEKARFELAVEAGRRTVAQEEWSQLGDQVPASEAGRRLALREPHWQAALAAFTGAVAAVEKAQWDLERTQITAPFDAVVAEKVADEGQVVTPQTRIARLVARDRFWVQVSIPLSDLAWIWWPDAAGEGGSPARVWVDLGQGRQSSREGRVVRILPDLEPAGRMARVLVEVSDPLQPADGVPLLLGAYAVAEILGPMVTNVFVVPREAIRESDQVWLMDAHDSLQIQTVQISRRYPDTVLVDRGLSAGDRVVTSRIALPVPGMKLRLLQPNPPSQAPVKPEASNDTAGASSRAATSRRIGP